MITDAELRATPPAVVRLLDAPLRKRYAELTAPPKPKLFKGGPLPPPKMPKPAPRRLPKSRKTPLKVGPLPPAPVRLTDEDAIARFIAERGVTRCPPAFVAPSVQGALSEREADTLIRRFVPLHEAGVNEVCLYLRQNGHKPWTNHRQYRLDGRVVERGMLFRVANEIRQSRGLTPYPMPNALGPPV